MSRVPEALAGVAQGGGLVCRARRNAPAIDQRHRTVPALALVDEQGQHVRAKQREIAGHDDGSRPVDDVEGRNQCRQRADASRGVPAHANAGRHRLRWRGGQHDVVGDGRHQSQYRESRSVSSPKGNDALSWPMRDERPPHRTMALIGGRFTICYRITVVRGRLRRPVMSGDSLIRFQRPRPAFILHACAVCEMSGMRPEERPYGASPLRSRAVIRSTRLEAEQRPAREEVLCDWLWAQS